MNWNVLARREGRIGPTITKVRIGVARRHKPCIGAIILSASNDKVAVAILCRDLRWSGAVPSFGPEGYW
jgi:hypothetical protein